MSAPPTGTITFLFTDIAGSSSRFERHGEAMHLALAQHDALLREAISRHGGHLFKTWGDAFLAAFPAAPAAVAAALEVQIALCGSPEAEAVGRLLVRMALHSGPAELRGGDYFGDTLNRASRLLRVAHGGQILLSGATADLVGSAVPPSARLVDLGNHRLRDLQRAERVFELQHPALPSGLPPLLSLEHMPTNLPQQFTSFVGREREIAEVKRLLASTRLLTLMGTGGAGKTRLSLQVAAEVLDEYADGVWLVELAALRDPSLVPRTVCAALRLPEEPGRDALSTLLEHSRQRRMLLLLDNCEHLIAASTSLVESLLRECASLRILATSRERLQINGETVWRVPSLGLPTGSLQTEGDLESASRAEAVRLFHERAKSVEPGFTLTPARIAAIAEICRRLDGIPLAIELAAALVNVMPPEEIAANLQDFFRILTRGSRTGMERQQTLRGAILWSYDLLTPQEQALSRRLSVFRGGWSLTAAQSVCAGSDFGGWDVLDHLGRLVDKSLVFREDADAGAARYRMLESVRQFAQERLEEVGESAAIAEAHCDYYLSLAEEAEMHLQGPDQQRYLEQLEREHDNLRAALAWSEEGDERLRIALALHRFWLVRGYLAEGRRWLEGALTKSDEIAGELRAKASNAAGALCWAQGDIVAARDHFVQALEMARKLNNQKTLPGYLSNLATMECEIGEYAHARELYEETLAIYKKAGDTQRAGTVLNNLGVLLLNQRDFDVARTFLEEALRVQRGIGDRAGIALCEANLARLDIDTGESQNAREHARVCLQSRLELGDLRGIATINFILALADIKEGNYIEAVRRISGTDSLRSRLGVVPSPVETREMEAALATCRRHLSNEQFDHAWSNGVSFHKLQS